MQKDYGLFLFLLFLLICWYMTTDDSKGYSSLTSDWSQVGYCDWATNMPCANYYGCNSQKFRTMNREKFIKDLIAKKSLVVGLDYYSMFYVTKGLIPPQIIYERQKELRAGKVFLFTVSLDSNRIIWRPINE